MGSVLDEYTPSELQELLNTSNSYSHLLRRLGLNPKGANPETLHKKIELYHLDETKLNENRTKLYSECGNRTKELFIRPIDDYFTNKKTIQSSKLLQRLIKEGYKKYQCEICGISEWMDKPISLHLHHKNGNHNDNSLDNLQILCPNCHSQTDTFAGKSSKKRIKKVKTIKKRKISLPPIDRELLKFKIRSMPFVRIGSEYSVSDTTIRKWCKKLGLPSRVTEINSYSDEEWEQI